MIDFAPTEEQTAIRDLAHQVAVEQLRRLARPAEEAGRLPAELHQLLVGTGLLTPVPEDYGGSGEQDAVTHALIAEELAYGDGGLAFSVIGSLLAPLAVLASGVDAMIETLLTAYCTNCSVGSMGALGWSEPAAGLDVRQTLTTLRRDGPDFVLEGIKRSVAHGQTSGLRVVLARLEEREGLNGLRLVVLPENAAGVEVTPEADPLGLRATPRARMRLNNVAIPPDAILGGADMGAEGAQRFVALANILLGGLAVGIARAALDYSADYAKVRIQFSRPISSYQSIAFMAAEMAMDLDAARLLIWRAAQTWDLGQDALRLAERARMQAVKTAQKVTIDAVQILGGAGFLQDYPVEIWMRDAAALATLG